MTSTSDASDTSTRSKPPVVSFSPFHPDAQEFEEYLLYGSKLPSVANSLVLNEREADSVPTTVKNLRVQRFQLANSSVNASSSLRTLVLADHSGLPEARFELNGYRELQKLRIGSYCYRNETCSFSLSNCPKLKSIQIGPESFEHCKSFELKDFPSLQTVELGDENFFETTAITFKSATIGGFKPQTSPVSNRSNAATRPSSTVGRQCLRVGKELTHSFRPSQTAVHQARVLRLQLRWPKQMRRL